MGAQDEGDWCVLLVTRDTARVFRGGPTALREVRELHSDVKNQHAAGGWSQARFERSVEREVEWHLEAATDLLFQLFKRRPFEHLVIGANNESLRPALDGRDARYLDGADPRLGRHRRAHRRARRGARGGARGHGRAPGGAGAGAVRAAGRGTRHGRARRRRARRGARRAGRAAGRDAARARGRGGARRQVRHVRLARRRPGARPAPSTRPRSTSSTTSSSRRSRRPSSSRRPCTCCAVARTGRSPRRRSTGRSRRSCATERRARTGHPSRRTGFRNRTPGACRWRDRDVPFHAHRRHRRRHARRSPPRRAPRPPATTPTSCPPKANRGKVRAAVLCLHNQERAAHGLRPLKANKKLRRAAEGHSSCMVRASRFEHGDLAGRIRRPSATTAGPTARTSPGAPAACATARRDPPCVDELARAQGQHPSAAVQ